jgi:hypothetical protein
MALPLFRVAAGHGAFDCVEQLITADGFCLVWQWAGYVLVTGAEGVDLHVLRPLGPELRKHLRLGAVRTALGGNALKFFVGNRAQLWR